jgi:hypothetical protein
MKYLLSSVAIVAALAIASPVSAQGYGPGPGARTGTGPGVTPPRGARSLLADVQSAGAGGTGVRATGGGAASSGDGSRDGPGDGSRARGDISSAADAPACPPSWPRGRAPHHAGNANQRKPQHLS